MAKQQRIGLFGGSFDPVHSGHIRLAQKVLDHDYVDQLYMIPTGNPPHKSCLADPEDRWRMLVSACSCDERLLPSRTELDRNGTVYAVDTLRQFKQDHPKAKLFYIIGTDALMNLHKWYHLEEVLSLCTFLVLPRNNSRNSSIWDAEIQKLAGLGGRFRVLPFEFLPVSSSEIRSLFAAGSVPDSLDIPVLEYCLCKGLYGSTGLPEFCGEWINKLFSSLKPGRFAHSLSVAYTAKRLARIHSLDTQKAEQAGLLHDCAKHLPITQMQKLASDHALTVDPDILASSALLHSIVGAYVAKEQYGMEDPEVLEAIRYHNTGRAGMSRLAVCVCLSDSIEPLRKSYPRLEEIRRLSEVSLEKALLLSLESTAEYVLSRGKYLHPRTRETIAWLRNQCHE